MTQHAEMASFLTDARHVRDLQSVDLPEAPLAMPEQDLTQMRPIFSWRRLRDDVLVRS